MRWRRASNEHQRSAPLRRSALAGHHRKGDDRVRANKVVFKVARNATKPQIKEAVEKLFDVKVKSVNTLIRKGKYKVFKGMMGEQQIDQARHRDARRGPPHRRDDRSVKGRGMALKIIQTDHAEPAAARPRRSLQPLQRQAGEERWSKARIRPAAATISAASPRGSAAAATSRPTARSISSAPRPSRRRSSASNTIRTAPPSSR